MHLACGKVDQAIKFHEKRRDHDEALLIAASKSTGIFNKVPSEAARDKVKEVHDFSVFHDITSKLADKYFENCQPILSAASHLSIPDPEAALTKFLRSHELTYAFILAKLYLLSQKDILEMLARNAEKFNDWELGMKLLENEKESKELFAAKLPNLEYERFHLHNIN